MFIQHLFRILHVDDDLRLYLGQLKLFTHLPTYTQCTHYISYASTSKFFYECNISPHKNLLDFTQNVRKKVV